MCYTSTVYRRAQETGCQTKSMTIVTTTRTLTTTHPQLYFTAKPRKQLWLLSGGEQVFTLRGVCHRQCDATSKVTSLSARAHNAPFPLNQEKKFAESLVGQMRTILQVFTERDTEEREKREYFQEVLLIVIHIFRPSFQNYFRYGLNQEGKGE